MITSAAAIGIESSFQLRPWGSNDGRLRDERPIDGRWIDGRLGAASAGPLGIEKLGFGSESFAGSLGIESFGKETLGFGRGRRSRFGFAAFGFAALATFCFGAFAFIALAFATLRLRRLGLHDLRLLRRAPRPQAATLGLRLGRGPRGDPGRQLEVGVGLGLLDRDRLGLDDRLDRDRLGLDDRGGLGLGDRLTRLVELRQLNLDRRQRGDAPALADGPLGRDRPLDCDRLPGGDRLRLARRRPLLGRLRRRGRDVRHPQLDLVDRLRLEGRGAAGAVEAAHGACGDRAGQANASRRPAFLVVGVDDPHRHACRRLGKAPVQGVLRHDRPFHNFPIGGRRHNLERPRATHGISHIAAGLPGMISRMAVGAMTFFYKRLGGRYPIAFMAVELQTALFIVAGTLALFTFYFDATSDEYLAVLAIALGLTELAILASLWRIRGQIRPISEWIDGERDADATHDAWSSAINLPVLLLKRDLPIPVLVSVLPICIVSVMILDLPMLAVFPLLAGAAVAMGYSAILHYLAVEAGMRPVLLDINSNLSPRQRTDFWAVSLRTRLMVALPLINLITGLVVAALTSNGGGGSNLGLDVLVALLVATTISLELTVMLSRSILRPLRDLAEALDRVSEGDLQASVPVTTGDELGELAASFNEMVAGLAERERIRDAFGTYLDHEVAEYILSEGFSEQGVEVEVTVMFCDVREFTEFANDATPQQVVAALNRLFEVIVPIIASHGGHIDKFEGDGLLAVFGAPEPYPDHADRAVRAACAIGAAINDRGEAGELRIGVGVNSGQVIAGAIGGAGRLNFSVIGGAVNVAARTEAQTRETDDAILITDDTWTRLSDAFEAESRGRFELKGVAEPVELYAPRIADRDGRPEPAPVPELVPLAGFARRLARAARPGSRR